MRRAIALRGNRTAIIQRERIERMEKFWRPLTIQGSLNDPRTGWNTRASVCAREGRGKDMAGGRTPITVYRVGFHRGVESSIGELGNRLAQRGRQPE